MSQPRDNRKPHMNQMRTNHQPLQPRATREPTADQTRAACEPAAKNTSRSKQQSNREPPTNRTRISQAATANQA